MADVRLFGGAPLISRGEQQYCFGLRFREHSLFKQHEFDPFEVLEQEASDWAWL